MLIDYHVHTNYTVDAEGTVDEYCKAAVKNGFSEICFTNHMEWSCVADGTYGFALRDESWRQHIDEIESARQRYPELRIKLGVELGYFEQWRKDIVSFPKKYPFDYVLGSLHWVNGRLLSAVAGEKRERPADYAVIYREYFRELDRMINIGNFDCIGHFDIVKKNMPGVDLSEYIDEVLVCIKSMKNHDIGFELNTMGWDYPCKEPFPSPGVLGLLHDAGIRKVTIGSDTHHPQMQGFRIKEGISLLKDAGFDKICTFLKRKARYHNL